MTPAEKANQIYNKYYTLLFQYGIEEFTISILAKKSALIAISDHNGEYWQEVRKNINSI